MKCLWAPWRIGFILGAKKPTGCVFCDLPKEQADEKNLILSRSTHCFTILNKYPYNSGHLMVVPYTHTHDLASLADEVLLELHQKKVEAIEALKKAVSPEGFNIGMNLGQVAGAGIKDHLHYHIVPRWTGDTNFMPVFGETKVLPESLEDTYQRLKKALS